MILPTCCVCGEEGEYLHHGLWWCEKHHSYVRKKTKPGGKSKEGLGEEGRRPPENLGLEWV